jgi:hypothetical protein
MQETRPRELTPEEVALTGYQSTVSSQSEPLLVPPGSDVSIDRLTDVTTQGSPPTIPTQLPPQAK